MVEKLKEVYGKYQEMINYLIIGVLTTVISLIVKYALLFTILDAKDGLQLQISIIVSWVVAVVFAYITNRTFVFKSKNEKILKEIFLFFSSRIVTLVMESVILWFFITYLKLNSNIYVVVWTVLTQFSVIVGNYVLSKFIVFSKKEKTEKKRKITKEQWFYLVFFFLVLVLCYFFPYTHDDWDWGSTTGLERLQNGFSNFNGRWLGNSLGMLLTRVRILRSLTISFTMLGIIVCIKKLVNGENKYIPFFSILLILLMPVRMFAQSFAWTVGFANYVPPVLVALFIIYKNKTLFQEKLENLSHLWSFPFLILGFAGTLFMEHLTIYLFLLGLFLLGYQFIKFKKVSLPNIAYFIGSILGSILMFSNSGYRTLFGEGDGYRSIEDGNFIVKAIKTYFGDFKDLLVNNNFILNVVLCLIILIFSYQFLNNSRKNKISNLKKVLLKVANFVLIIFISYQFFLKMTNGANPFIKNSYQDFIEGILILVYAVAIISIIVVAISNSEKKKRMLFEIGSIAMISLPLLIVKPIGPRCFFPTYALFVLVAAEFLDLITEKLKIDLQWIFRVASYVIISFYLVIYGYCFMVEQKRVAYMEKNRTAEKLILPNIPYGNFMQVPNPRSEWFRTQYRQFYGLRENTKLEFIDYKEWKKKYEK